MTFGKTRCDYMIYHPPTASNYVRDGLIAMWDGIENVGFGVHDESATSWKDLAGDRDATLIGGAWDVDCLTGKDKILAQCSNNPLNFMHIEAVFLINELMPTSSSNTYRCVFKSNGYNP